MANDAIRTLEPEQVKKIAGLMKAGDMFGTIRDTEWNCTLVAIRCTRGGCDFGQASKFNIGVNPEAYYKKFGPEGAGWKLTIGRRHRCTEAVCPGCQEQDAKAAAKAVEDAEVLTPETDDAPTLAVVAEKTEADVKPQQCRKDKPVSMTATGEAMMNAVATKAAEAAKVSAPSKGSVSFTGQLPSETPEQFVQRYYGKAFHVAMRSGVRLITVSCTNPECTSPMPKAAFWDIGIGRSSLQTLANALGFRLKRNMSVAYCPSCVGRYHISKNMLPQNWDTSKPLSEILDVKSLPKLGQSHKAKPAKAKRLPKAAKPVEEKSTMPANTNSSATVTPLNGTAKPASVSPSAAAQRFHLKAFEMMGELIDYANSCYKAGWSDKRAWEAVVNEVGKANAISLEAFIGWRKASIPGIKPSVSEEEVRTLQKEFDAIRAEHADLNTLYLSEKASIDNRLAAAEAKLRSLGG